MGILEHHLSQPKARGKALPQPVKSKPAPIKPKAKKARPIPKEVREAFGHWFNHGYEAIAKEDGQNWTTFKYPLSPGKIWDYWQASNVAIGLRFGKETPYGMLDIDAPSKYHTPSGLAAIKDALAILGIEDSLLIQSSNSGGWHLYFFLPQAIPTFALACGLQDALEMAGLTLKKGQLEAFPNRKGRTKQGFTLYNGHRLPLQTGSALLDDDGNPYSQSLETFLRQAEWASECVDMDLLLSTCQDAHQSYTASLFAGKTKYQPLARQFGGKRLLKELNLIIDAGWTAHGLSNDILGAIAAKGRIFHGLGGQALADFVYQTAIDAPGFAQYCRHQKECPAWAVRWARCSERKYYPYGSRKGGDFKPLKEAGPTNEERQADAMLRVADAVGDYQASGRAWPDSLSKRRTLIAKMANCSGRTLAKPTYLPLWHPDHRLVADDVAVIHPIAEKPHTEQVSDISPRLDHTPPITVGVPSCSGSEKKESSTSSILSVSHSIITIPATCTTPSRPPKTKTVQNLTQQGIEPFCPLLPVPITPRLTIVKNPESQPQSQFQRSNVVPIAKQPAQGWETLPPFQPGDLVVEAIRPGLLLRLESIDDDGEWCRCRDVEWGRSELCLLSELREPALGLLGEEVKNG